MTDPRFSPLFAYYERIDGMTVEFRERLGLRCPAGCGWCCETGDPEITVLEALPLARQIIADPSLLAKYEAYLKDGKRKPCFFYDANADYRCSVYSIRPMLCRMFGYAGGRDKLGKPRFAPCSRMENAGRCLDVEKVPVFQDLQYGLLALAPPELARIAAFPDALAEAVQREMLRVMLTTDDEPDGRTPPTSRAA